METRINSSVSPYRTVVITRRTWLTEAVFELALARPDDFAFSPGQFIRVIRGEAERAYTMVSGPDEGEIRLCIQRTPAGAVSPFLAKAPLGAELRLTGPHGYFVFHPSEERAVFVATGTGIAPFVSMVNAGVVTGVRRFTLLQGADSPQTLYYKERFRAADCDYAPCVPGCSEGGIFSGRVTDYLSTKLGCGSYAFYLCGNREMIRDVTHIIDDRFPDARVYSEAFF